MSAIEKPQLENTQTETKSPSADNLRLEAMRLLLDVPEAGLQSVVSHIKTVTEIHTEDDSQPTEDSVPKKGTLGSLLKHALEANIFDDPDLRGDVDEYIKKISLMNDDAISSD